MTDVPLNGAPVVLRDQYGGSYRSEVLRSQPGFLVLRTPPDLPADQLFQPGTRLLVTWPDAFSLLVLPVLIIEVGAGQAEDGVLVAEIQGAPWREERRQYVRSTMPATLEICYDDPHGEQVVGAEAALIDLSEVALRAAVSPRHHPLSRPQTQVLARLELTDDLFEIGGYVLLGKPVARLDLSLEVVVLFHRPVPRIEELRRYLGALVPAR
jgi:hypothetical protein